MTFIQNPPELGNQYHDDPILPSYLQLILPDNVFNEIKDDIEYMGELTINSILEFGLDAQSNEPVLQQFDAWGNRVDDIITSIGWQGLKDIAAEEGLISIGYQRDYGKYSRIYQMAKILLYTPSSAIYTCPLAMTDGAARLIEEVVPNELSEVFSHLTSNDVDQFWTAGQWMTEKEGGSDISNSSTIAKKIDGTENQYTLWGDKWFTSAITGEMAMTLARIEDDNGNIIQGSRGLSLFYLRIRDDNDNLNNIKIHKLKDKLGTRALPTAELTLEGSIATQLGEIGRGVKLISTILNITRIYNAVSSISYMQRGLALLKDYGEKRVAFGHKINDLPLHNDLLVELESNYISSFLFVMYAIELMGRVETNEHTEEDTKILRIMTPLVKLYTGKQVVSFVSEVVEGFGGIGYIEETELPALFRDAQVFPIWEGTTNVLSLDVLRSIQKENTFQPLIKRIQGFLELKGSDKPKFSILRQSTETIVSYFTEVSSKSREIQELAARKFAINLSKLVIQYRLLDFQNKLKEKNLDQKLLNKLEIIIKRMKPISKDDLMDVNGEYLNENKLFFN